jgi:hypothetical protein
MDINMMQRQAPPPAQGMTPQQYYMSLYQQGYNPQDAYNAVTAAFGPPPTKQDQAEQAAAEQQKAALASMGGSLAGLGTVIGLQQLGTGGSAGAMLGGTTPATIAAAGQSAGLVGTGTAAGTAAGTAGAGAGATGAGATTGASTLGSIGSVALPVAAVVATASNAWETGMKDIVRGRGDRADWTNQLVNMTPVGLPINMGLRLLGKRSVGAMMKSGKSGVQKVRDSFRGDLKEAGVADDKYMVTLADGSKFNIGLDGKTKYQNVGKNIDGKTTRNAWDVDWSNPLAKFATDKIDPMIRNIYGADDKKAGYMPEQFTGILVNAATSNAQSEQDVIANIETMLGKSKFAQQAGVGVQPPLPAKAPKGQVVRVSPGMYMNDQGQVKPAMTVRQALEANYGKKTK